MKFIRNFYRKRALGFTLIELMIAVAIIAVLTAVAIPAYLSYIRRSYLSEATSSISAIKSAEESFYTINNCYIEALRHPTNIPAGTSVAWYDNNFPSPNAWANNALGVKPDRLVRFAYTVYASSSLSAGGGCGATAPVTLPDPIGCVSGTANLFTNSVQVGSNWYVVVAQGNLNASNPAASNIISAIDDSTVFYCNEIE